MHMGTKATEALAGLLDLLSVRLGRQDVDKAHCWGFTLGILIVQWLRSIL